MVFVKEGGETLDSVKITHHHCPHQPMETVYILYNGMNEYTRYCVYPTGIHAYFIRFQSHTTIPRDGEKSDFSLPFPIMKRSQTKHVNKSNLDMITENRLSAFQG